MQPAHPAGDDALRSLHAAPSGGFASVHPTHQELTGSFVRYSSAADESDDDDGDDDSDGEEEGLAEQAAFFSGDDDDDIIDDEVEDAAEDGITAGGSSSSSLSDTGENAMLMDMLTPKGGPGRN